MEAYLTPVMEIIRFEGKDILTNSFDPELPPDDDF